MRIAALRRSMPLLFLVWCVSPFGSTTSVAESDAPRHYLSIVYVALDDLDSGRDAPPSVVYAPPVDVPDSVAKKIKPDTHGFLIVRIDRSGSVRSVEFDDNASPGALARPIRETLKRWKFEPARIRGVVKDADVPLRFEAKPLARARDEASARLAVPRLAFAVRPAHLPEFYTTFSSLQLAREGGELKTVRVEHTIQSPLGGTQIQSMTTMVREPERFGYVATGDTNAMPWLAATVVVEFTIDQAGVPHDVRAVESTCPVLEPEAVAAVPLWRYAPAMQEGKPITCTFQETVVFPASPRTDPPRFVQPLKDPSARRNRYRPPEYTVFTPPLYPTLLARRKERGEATVDVRLDAEGKVVDVTVVKRTNEAFGLALREAVLSSRFKPAQTSTGPVESRFQLQAQFGRSESKDAVPAEMIPAVDLTYSSNETPVPVAGLDRPPRLINGRPPQFRIGADHAGSTATVDLELVVDASGRVKEPVVISEPAPDLDYTAVQNVASWLFEPPLKQGQPVAAIVRVRVGPSFVRLVR